MQAANISRNILPHLAALIEHGLQNQKQQGLDLFLDIRETFLAKKPCTDAVDSLYGNLLGLTRFADLTDFEHQHIQAILHGMEQYLDSV